MPRARAPRRRSAGIYVATLIRVDPSRLWELTQQPSLHTRWDLRFSAIVPESTTDSGATRFRYERTVGLRTIRGTGTSIGERRSADGSGTSALRFDTDDRWSPVRDGRGYWRYVPTPGGVRFITGYDYAPGFGTIADLVIRPLVRWMTAWSFDRLRIWAETGTEPERWPVASVLAVWRRDRPRASRCRTTPPPDGAFTDQPGTLSTLEAP